MALKWPSYVIKFIMGQVCGVNYKNEFGCRPRDSLFAVRCTIHGTISACAF